MSYVVVVSQSDGATRVFGGFRNHDRALAFVEKVNAKVEVLEEEQREEHMDTMYGRAAVRFVRSPRMKDAIRFAEGWLE